MAILGYSNSYLLSPGGGYYLGSYDPKPDPYNPLNLPPYTMRLKMASTAIGPLRPHGTWTLVDQANKIYDFTYETSDWSFALEAYPTSINVVEVLGANTIDVTSMSGCFDYNSGLRKVNVFNTSNMTNMANMFTNCKSLTSVPAFDTSKNKTFYNMFNGCSSLPTVPLYDMKAATSVKDMFMECHSLTSVPKFDTKNVEDFDGFLYRCRTLTGLPDFDVTKATSMHASFYGNVFVNSGALNIYNKAANKEIPVSSHGGCFYHCGWSAPNGSAELEQIPSDWK